MLVQEANMQCSIDSASKQQEDFEAKTFKADFPLFAKHPDLIYFDNAATTQKPQVVLDVINDYYQNQCANAGRASYSWSSQLESAINDSRKKVADFLSADKEQVVFTAGATESLNLVTYAWALHNLKDGDEVMLCPKDHKSAVLPWYNVQALLKEQGKEIAIKHFDIHEVGDYDLKSIKEALTDKTRVIALAHVHHVFGLDMEVSEIRQIVGPDVIISLDASQSVGHTEVSAEQLPVDFISFSGHKMFAAPGVGVLFINPRLNSQIRPFKLGGKSKAVLSQNGFTLKHDNMADLLESGTQNIPAILSLAKAIDYVDNIGIDRIESHISELTVYLWQRLKELPGIEFAPGIGICGCFHGWGIVSFRFEQLSSSDLSFALDEEKIFVRSGDHCTYLSEDSESADDFIRVSMHLYNDKDDVDQFVDVLAGCTG